MPWISCERAARARPQGNIEAVPVPRIPQLRGSAPAMQQVFRAIGRLARSSVTVLITGESGTGKEIVARALHDHSPRAGKPFNSAQYLGDPGGPSRVGALWPRKGLIHRCGCAAPRPVRAGRRGTLFLDEIRDMSTPLQTRLLRVLAEGEFYRVGGQTPIRVDVRVIAATPSNLQTRVERGLFREDLYHRLNVIRIELETAARRRGGHTGFARALSALRKPRSSRWRRKSLRPNHRKLATYSWPGQRARSSSIFGRRLAVLRSGREVRIEDLPPELTADRAERSRRCDWARALAVWADARAMTGKRRFSMRPSRSSNGSSFAPPLKRTQGHRQEGQAFGLGQKYAHAQVEELGNVRRGPRTLLTRLPQPSMLLI